MLEEPGCRVQATERAMKQFADAHRNTARALQIWQILIGRAHQRQTVTYAELARLMGMKGAGVLSRMLDPVRLVCDAHGLPPLTILVVNATTGLPGEGLPQAELHAERERVFRHDWNAIYPPSEAELRDPA